MNIYELLLSQRDIMAEIKQKINAVPEDTDLAKKLIAELYAVDDVHHSYSVAKTLMRNHLRVYTGNEYDAMELMRQDIPTITKFIYSLVIREWEFTESQANVEVNNFLKSFEEVIKVLTK